MRTTIASIRPHTAAKPIACVSAVFSFLLFAATSLIQNVPALSTAGEAPVIILFSIGYAFLYATAVLVASYASVFVCCFLYNIVANHFGGIEYETD